MLSEFALIRGLQHVKPEQGPCAVGIGNFDGVHLGHQSLVAKLQAGAALRQLPAMVVLFEPQTGEFLLGEEAPARLMRLREKVKAIQALGIRRVLVLRFNQSLASLSAEQFIQQILLKTLQVRYLVAGDDFRFGHDRVGNLALIEKSGIEVAVAGSVDVAGQRVSSTRIRHALRQGKLAEAAMCLGRPFAMSGCVRAGEKRGRLMGFPTANLNVHRKQVPLSGVYAVTIEGIGSHALYGVANVGVRPTVDGRRVLLEVYIFDFNQTIYGCYLNVAFVHKLRDEARFESLDALRVQIFKDVQAAKDFFSTGKAIISLSA